MTALRHAEAVADSGGQRVSVNDGDALEVPAQDARGHQAAHAAADDDGVIACHEDSGGDADDWGAPPTAAGRIRSVRQRQPQVVSVRLDYG